MNDFQSTVKVTCSWDGDIVNESQGFIFGVKTFDATRRCKTKAERVLTIISSTMKKNCLTVHSNFKEWCKNYVITNATVDTTDTDSNVTTTTAVEFPVRSLFEYNISYNGTANSPILLYWLPHFTGQHDKTADDCITNVTFGGNSTNVTSPPADTPKPTTGGNSPATTTRLPFTTQLKPGKSLTSGEIAAIAFGIVVVLVAIALLWMYRDRAGCFKSCDGQPISMAGLPLDPNNTSAPAIH